MHEIQKSKIDTYAKETLFACLIGVILVPIAIPWHYVNTHYIAAKAKD
ncbi:MAG: hypothetical protein R3345_10655 [Fulvivirga sp.]|nr:hypothetical protein [Fulvivirga sp.]